MNARAERMARRLGLVAEGERVVLACSPSPLDIVLSVLGKLAALIVLAVVLWWVGPWVAGVFSAVVGGWFLWAAYIAIVLAVIVVVWNALVWAFRVYLLTDRRAVWVSGVLRRLVVECELDDVRQAVMFQPLRQRVFGLGTIGLATAGTDSYEVVWSAVDDPSAVLALVRESASASRKLDKAQRDSQQRQIMTASDDHKVEGHERGGPVFSGKSGRLPVIGIVGGIGAGKSEVASVFASLGCVVADSDRQVRAALDEPWVIDELKSWWGPAVLLPDGSVNRREVASIVFADSSQRSRLESLLHPLVHAARVEVIRRAAENGARGVIVDAPLLFEAGVDRECDAVVFVDTPWAVRAERVRESRGWTEEELARRESAQMSIEEKRGRCGYVIVNDGDLANIRPQAERVLKEIETAGVQDQQP